MRGFGWTMAILGAVISVAMGVIFFTGGLEDASDMFFVVLLLVLASPAVRMLLRYRAVS
ncbi:hypothetical protein OAS39_04280 [Pirellulales bacterium]|nr:hypothetical protein [Pirellulales bacterium]